MRDLWISIFIRVVLGGTIMSADQVSGQRCSWSWIEPNATSLTRSVGAPATFTASVNDVLSDADFLTWKSGTTDLSIGEYKGGSFNSLVNPRSFKTSFQQISNGVGHIYTLHFPEDGVSLDDNGGSITATSQGCTTGGTSPSVSLVVRYCDHNFFSSVANATTSRTDCGYNCVHEFSCLNVSVVALSFNATCKEDATWTETLTSAGLKCTPSNASSATMRDVTGPRLQTILLFILLPALLQ